MVDRATTLLATTVGTIVAGTDAVAVLDLPRTVAPAVTVITKLIPIHLVETTANVSAKTPMPAARGETSDEDGATHIQGVTIHDAMRTVASAADVETEMDKMTVVVEAGVTATATDMAVERGKNQRRRLIKNASLHQT